MAAKAFVLAALQAAVAATAFALSDPSSSPHAGPTEALRIPLARRSGGPDPGGKGQDSQGIGIVSFLTATGVAAVVFAVQFALFILLRNKLARIFKPKTYLVPERERTEAPPRNPIAMVKALVSYSDRAVINKCGLDAYFFLRYLKTLLVIFIPICLIVLPILIPINYVGGRGHNVDVDDKNKSTSVNTPTGLDTLAWANIAPQKTSRYAAHLVMGILVVVWVCAVFFFELRVYIKVRQDYLTSAEHRLRASATTVLVSSIPQKWLSDEALRGLFDVFPGGVKNVWLNRDLTILLDKISLREKVHSSLEAAETDLIKAAKKAQLKRRKIEEKKKRRQSNLKSPTKEERAAREALEDAEASRMANSGTGLEAGDQDEVPHTVDAGIQESESDALGRKLHTSHSSKQTSTQESRLDFDLGIKMPLSKVGRGLKGVVAKAGNEVNDTLGTTNGFTTTGPADTPTGRSHHPITRARAAPDRESHSSASPADTKPQLVRSHSHSASTSSACSSKLAQEEKHSGMAGNTVRKLSNPDDMILLQKPKFWQFWKPPTGGYASPIPQGSEAEQYMARRGREHESFWRRLRKSLPFIGDKADDADYEYPTAHASESDQAADQDEAAEWKKYLKKGDRPTHRLPLFGVTWLPGLPFITKKVDTIYWCRQELARLNVEIAEDQQRPERFPLMTSAFVQFNHQIAAHMACQSVVHHLPRQMSPRLNEISPRDVVWANMAASWWQEWLRTAIATVAICAMIFLWAIPVAWTAALSQLDKLIDTTPWLEFLRANQSVENFARAISGVLPAATLALLLILVPIILNLLAEFSGAKTGAQKSEFVQIFYFTFLFVQVFLIVSITSFFAASINTFVQNLARLESVRAVLDLLATNLPRAANYFFSYMVLQALSTSSGTLLQVGALLVWFVVAPMFDSTARNKWSRNTKLSDIRWGSFFPVYTNFACIALVYSVIAPLISVFAIITFSLLWLAQRYAMLYVTRFETDTGGVLYPRAINQTFTGLYFMELCMAGLFFLVQDETGAYTCTTHGVIMLVVLLLTVIYQVLLNLSFAPLFRYLPITYEDEAVLRDEAFQRAQDLRFGLCQGEPSSDGEGLEEEEEEEEEEGRGSADSAFAPTAAMDDKEAGVHVEQPQQQRRQRRHLRSHVKKVGHWAKGGGKQVGTWAMDGGHQLRKLPVIGDNSKAAMYRRQQRQKDVEAQRAIGDALYGSIHDDIEDLTAEERDLLTRHAFQHYALRARRPTVWIPRDDLGISDDEIRRTHDYSEHIWISNEGTALDSKVRVVYGKNPPDFSEVDIINL